MKFINTNKLQIANYMYNTIMTSYQIMLMKCSQPTIQTTHTTQDQLRIPKHNTNIIKYTVSLAGPKIWNSIAINIQNMLPVMFKQNVKTVLNGEIVVD